MAPKDNSTLSSVKAPGEFVAKKFRGMESMTYIAEQNRKTKIYRIYTAETTRNYSQTGL